MKSRGKIDVIYPIRDICSSLKLQVADVENTTSLFTLTSSNCTASDTYFENCFNLLCNIDGSNYGIILFTRRGNRNGKLARARSASMQWLKAHFFLPIHAKYLLPKSYSFSSDVFLFGTFCTKNQNGMLSYIWLKVTPSAHPLQLIFSP